MMSEITQNILKAIAAEISKIPDKQDKAVEAVKWMHLLSNNIEGFGIEQSNQWIESIWKCYEKDRISDI